MTIGLFLGIGLALNLVAFIISFLVIDDIRVLAFLICVFIPYCYTLGFISFMIVCLIEWIKRL